MMLLRNIAEIQRQYLVWASKPLKTKRYIDKKKLIETSVPFLVIIAVGLFGGMSTVLSGEDVPVGIGAIALSLLAGASLGLVISTGFRFWIINALACTILAAPLWYVIATGQVLQVWVTVVVLFIPLSFLLLGRAGYLVKIPLILVVTTAVSQHTGYFFGFRDAMFMWNLVTMILLVLASLTISSIHAQYEIDESIKKARLIAEVGEKIAQEEKAMQKDQERLSQQNDALEAANRELVEREREIMKLKEQLGK